MALKPLIVTFFVFAVVCAEPPSPYHYNKPPPPPPRPSYSAPAFHSAPAPQPSYNAPSFHSAPAFQAAPSFQPAPSFHAAPSGSYGAPSISVPVPAPAPPSTSYGYPQGHAPAPSFTSPAFTKPAQSYGGPSLHGQSSNQNTIVSNLISGGGSGGLFDDELRNTIETILLKEETREASEVSFGDGTQVVSISMDGPRPALGVAQFVLSGQGNAGSVGQPSPVYGASR